MHKHAHFHVLATKLAELRVLENMRKEAAATHAKHTGVAKEVSAALNAIDKTPTVTAEESAELMRKRSILTARWEHLRSGAENLPDWVLDPSASPPPDMDFSEEINRVQSARRGGKPYVPHPPAPSGRGAGYRNPYADWKAEYQNTARQGARTASDYSPSNAHGMGGWKAPAVIAGIGALGIGGGALLYHALKQPTPGEGVQQQQPTPARVKPVKTRKKIQIAVPPGPTVAPPEIVPEVA